MTSARTPRSILSWPRLGTYRALLDDVQRRGERARAQQQCELPCLAGEQAGDLEVAAEYAADGRDADDLLLGALGAGTQARAGLVVLDPLLLDEHDRHRPAEVLAGRLQHLGGATRVELHVDRGLTLLEPGACVHQLLARHDEVALQQDRLVLTGVIELRAERRTLGTLGLGRIVLVVDQPELERRGGAEYAQRLVRILHAGQLHDDPVDALPRDDRLRDAELVHAIAQRRDVLLDREVLPLLDAVRRERDAHGAALAERVGLHDEIGVLLSQQRGHAIGIGSGSELDRHDVPAVRLHPGERDALVSQQRPVVPLHALEQLLDRALHVDFVEEVHAPAQVEAEAHRLEAKRTHPRRSARRLRQRDQVVARGRPADRLARLELLIHGVEAQHEAVALAVLGLDRYRLGRQDAGDCCLGLVRECRPVVA